MMYSFTQPVVIPNLESNMTYNLIAAHIDTNGCLKCQNSNMVAYLPTVRGKVGTTTYNTQRYNTCTFGNDTTTNQNVPSPGITFGKVADVTPDRIYVIQTVCLSGFATDYVEIFDATSSDNGYVTRTPITSTVRMNLFTGYDLNGKLQWFTHILNSNSSMPRVFDTCASRGGITLCAGSCGNTTNPVMQLYCNGLPYGTSNLMTVILSTAYTSFLIGLYSNGFPRYYLRSNASSIRVAQKPSDNSFYVALVTTAGSMLYYGGADMFGNGKYSSMDVGPLNGIVLINIIDGIPQDLKISIQAVGCALQALKTAANGSIFISLTCDSNQVIVTDASGVPKTYTASSMTNANACFILKLNANLSYSWCCFGQLQVGVSFPTVTSEPLSGTVVPSQQTNIPTIFTCLIDVTPTGSLVAVTSPSGLYSTSTSSFATATTFTTAVTVSSSSLMVQIGSVAGTSTGTGTSITYVSGSATPTFVHNMYMLRLDGVNGTIQTHAGFGQSDSSSFNSVYYLVRPLSVACGGNDGFVLGWKQLQMQNYTSYAYTYQGADGTTSVSTGYAANSTFSSIFNPGSGDKQYITAFDAGLKMAWESGFLTTYELKMTGEVSVSFNVTDSAYLVSSWGRLTDGAGPRYYDTGTRSTDHFYFIHKNRWGMCDRLFLSIGLKGNIV
jgi:hypothetical protein